MPSRRGLCREVILLMFLSLGPVPAVLAVQDRLAAAIARAGNAESDRTRLAILKRIRDDDALAVGYKADLEKLIGPVERWVNDTRLPWFGGGVGRRIDFDFGIAPGSPFEPLTWLYRGRMVAWYAAESGSVWANPQRRKQFFDVARGFFERYARAFPGNGIAGMYLGRPIAPLKHYDVPDGAPRWAAAQREALERLADIIEWWIDNRMQEDGQYGGGWGDDCEMWRWWVPVLIGFDSPKITAAQARFSEAMMSQPHMAAGYTNRMTDVEHTAEDSADVITPMMHLEPDNPRWLARAMKLAEYMETLWTGRNRRGLLQFKSTYFTAERVDTNPQRACDTVYHPRAVQPSLLYWQRTAEPRLTRLFSAWMDTWVDAAARGERDKPAGIIPSAIHWPDGSVGGAGEDWWDPKNHGETTLYLWPSAMSMMTDTLLLTYHMTGQQKYLEPIRSMARIRLRYLKSGTRADAAAGSESWCAARLGLLAGTIAKYRFLTGDSRFDELLGRGGSRYMRFRLAGDLRGLVEALNNTAEALRINFPGYTSEVRYTDRVLRFPAMLNAGLAENTSVPIRSPDTSLLYSCVTGDPGEAGYFPLNAVRWLTRPRNIAALVTDSGTKSFAAELYSFDAGPRQMAAELYLLEKGEYRVELVGAGIERTSRVAVRGPRTRITFELPGRKLCSLKVTRRQ